MLNFNEKDYRRSLGTLSARLRAVFAASCAQRLFPAVTAYTSRIGTTQHSDLVVILDDLWRALLDEDANQVNTQSHIQRCMELIDGMGGDEDEAEVADSATMTNAGFAQDALAVVVHALNALRTGDVDEAVHAATIAYDARDRQAQYRLSAGELMIGADEHVLLADRNVQAELERQQHDLDDLTAGIPETTETIHRLRQRATSNAFPE